MNDAQSSAVEWQFPVGIYFPIFAKFVCCMKKTYTIFVQSIGQGKKNCNIWRTLTKKIDQCALTPNYCKSYQYIIVLFLACPRSSKRTLSR